MNDEVKNPPTYVDSDGARRPVSGTELFQDKGGKYWFWSEALNRPLACKTKDREDCLLAAIDTLLAAIATRDERIAELKRVADLAHEFAAAANLGEAE